LEKFVGEIIAVIHRENDIEDKWVAVPKGMTLTADEIIKQTYFQEKYFKTTVILL
jgi:inorganic pyrophosphatase